MKIFFIIIAFIFISQSSYGGNIQRAMISINEVRVENSVHDVIITLLNESSEVIVTDILLLVEISDPHKLIFIRDDDGNPVTAMSKTSKEWSARFKLDRAYSAIYAVAVNRKESLAWSKSRDLSALARISTSAQDSLEGKLLLLMNFGWTPIGYTFYGSSEFKPKSDRDSISQNNTSNLCQTSFGICEIYGFSKVGSRCSCQNIFGRKEGTIISNH